MAELKISKDEVIGIKKEIDEGSLELIFNALQSDIYSYPIRSFIRETVSNGLDSIIEKNVYRNIEAGEPVEKYFRMEQDNALLKDSEYDPTYYNTEHLSTDDKVYVKYFESSPRDKVSITDKGVGLGGSRLRGFFKVGYSSKRNFFTARGLFGLGSKSALATGVEYFTLTTVYNGYKTKFMVFNRDYENITPKMAGGKTDVWKVTMANDDVVDKNIYWEPCSEPNSVTIEVEVKKHNKQTYIDAVKDQFQYFKGAVNLQVYDSRGQVIKTDTLNERPEYESEHILIPKYSTYSSPHILVDGISYGLVSWDELELEHRKGKIALKVSANDVDITQSRESLKWTDKTKQAVLKSIKIAEDEASEYVRGTISLEDKENIFAMCAAYSSVSSVSSNTVTSVFSRFLAIHNIRPKYQFTLPAYQLPSLADENKMIEVKEAKLSHPLTHLLFEFLFYSYDFRLVFVVSEGGKLKIRTEVIRDFDRLSNYKIIYSQGASLGPKLAMHLLNKYDASSFVYVRANTTRIKSHISMYNHGTEYSTERIRVFSGKLLRKYCDLQLDNYEADFSLDTPEEELNENSDTEVKETKITQAMQRKMNKEVMWYTYAFKGFAGRYSAIPGRAEFFRTKCVSPIAKLDEKVDYDTIVVPSSMTDLGKLLLLVEKYQNLPARTEFVFVSNENLDHFMSKGATHIQNYFRTLDLNTGELMIGDYLVELNTAYQFKKIKEEYLTFANSSEIISKITSLEQNKYRKYLYDDGKHLHEVLRSLNDTKAIEEVIGYLNNLAEFQKVVASKDPEQIAAKSQEMFGTDKIHNVYAYDKDYIDLVESELKRISPIAPIITSISTYSDECTPLLNLLVETIHKKENQKDD